MSGPPGEFDDTGILPSSPPPFSNTLPARPIAIVVEPLDLHASTAHQALYELFAERLIADVLPNLEIPFEQRDIESFCASADRYRVALFAWADQVASGFRPLLRQWVEQKGHIAVWFHAPGLQDEGGESLNYCQDLTGITVNADPLTNALEVSLTNFSHPFTRGFEGKSSFGSGRREPYRFRPHFYADDGRAVTLGRLVGSDRPGLVVKPVGEGTSVYCAAPLPYPELLRRICLGDGTLR